MKIQYSTCPFCALIIFVVLALLIEKAVAAAITNTTVLSNEFWISTNIESQDLGTLDNPFICATEPEFDYTMSNLPPNCTIHILAGTYRTLGCSIRPGYELKAGQKILGSGMDNTIIQLVTDAPSGNFVMGSVGRAQGIDVSDLTLDCHYIPGVSRNATYGGLDLNGRRIAVRRVKVINLVYLDATVNSESFGIGINSTYGGPFNSDGDIIEECEVSNFVAGTACSAIALNGGCISGIVRNNRVFLQGASATLDAFNGGNMHDVLVEGNYVDGGGTAIGFYGDAGGYTNIIVTHNTFKNCYYGVALSGYPRQNIMFCYNQFTIPNSGGIGFVFNANTSFTNIVITGNDVHFDSRSSPGSLFLCANNIFGLTVNNNTVDPILTNIITGCSGVSIYNNFNLDGDLLVTPGFNQVMPPNGVTRNTDTNSVYVVSYEQEYVGVQATNVMLGRHIYLPSPVGYPGKRFVIADESGTASSTYPIIISASTPPFLINRKPSVSISSAYGAVTIVGDGLNWFAH